MADSDDYALFAAKSVCCCILWWISVILFACAFSVLEPLEYGIEVNYNSYTVNYDKLHRGGRHFLGLGHAFIKYPANRVLLAYTEWQQIGQSEEDGCSLDDECWLDSSDCSACLEGVMPASQSELIGQNFVLKHDAILARTREGLRISIQVGVELDIGLTADEQWGFSDVSEPPQPGKKLAESIFGLYHNVGEEWTSFLHIAIDAAMRDEIAEHNATDFYGARRVIGNKIRSKVQENLLPLNITVHDLSITNLALPRALELAIQRTEVARQGKEAAEYEKRTREIQAYTKVETTIVSVQRLLHKSLRMGEQTLLNRVAVAMQIQYELEKMADAYKYVYQTMGYTSVQDLFVFKWLYAIRSTKGQLLFDMPIPHQFTFDYQPHVDTQESAPMAHIAKKGSLREIAGLNRTFNYLEEGKSPNLNLGKPETLGNVTTFFSRVLTENLNEQLLDDDASSGPSPVVAGNPNAGILEKSTPIQIGGGTKSKSQESLAKDVQMWDAILKRTLSAAGTDSVPIVPAMESVVSNLEATGADTSSIKSIVDNAKLGADAVMASVANKAEEKNRGLSESEEDSSPENSAALNDGLPLGVPQIGNVVKSVSDLDGPALGRLAMQTVLEKKNAANEIVMRHLSENKIGVPAAVDMINSNRRMASSSSSSEISSNQDQDAFNFEELNDDPVERANRYLQKAFNEAQEMRKHAEMRRAKGRI